MLRALATLERPDRRGAHSISVEPMRLPSRRALTAISKPMEPAELRGDQLELVEQRAAEQVDAFEPIDEAGGRAQEQAQAARHHRARQAVAAVAIGRQHQIVIAPGVEDLAELDAAGSVRRRESR